MNKKVKNLSTPKKLNDLFLRKSDKAKFGGAGEGGVYRDKTTGKDYLIKRVSTSGITDPVIKRKSNWRSWDEILAARFFKAAGVLVPNMFAVEDENGVIYVASTMIPGTKDCTEATFRKLPAANKDLVLASQLLHCWLGNRDIVNGKGENYVYDADNRVYNVDFGATLFSGFRSIISGEDDVNFTAQSIHPFLLDRHNDHFGIFQNRSGVSVKAFNIESTKGFFSDFLATDDNERKYQIQGALMIEQFSEQDIEDLVNSTGHTKEEKQSRIDALKARKVVILDYITKKYGEHALREEQISLELQRIFHKYGIFNNYKKITGGSDAVVSYRSQYTNAIKPQIKINKNDSISINFIDNNSLTNALPILHRLSGKKTEINNSSIAIDMQYNDFIEEMHKEFIANTLQVFFSSFGHNSDIQDLFHRSAYKGDGHTGFRPLVLTQDGSIVFTLSPNHTDHEKVLTQFSETFHIDPLTMKVKDNALHIHGITLEQLAGSFMQNSGARKTAVVSEGKEGTILAGKLDLEKKGVSGFATAGGGSEHPYNPIRAACEEGTDEFGHAIKKGAQLIPIGSTLTNKKKNIFLVQPGDTAENANSHIDYKEFQDGSIRYYSFKEFREAFRKDKTKFDRTSVDLYLRHYQREIQKNLHSLGIDNVLVHISKKPGSLGKIYLKPSIEHYDYFSSKIRMLNPKCHALMKTLFIPNTFRVIEKKSQQGKKTHGQVALRQYIELSEEINPAQFQMMLFNLQTNPASKTSAQPDVIGELHKILINKIDNYLQWRANKDIDDGRGYTTGFFSKVRHYSEFGKNRAEGLKNSLNNMKTKELGELLPILQTHLSHASTLNNHSLDTYLLEGIVAHGQLFHFNETFTLKNNSDRLKLRETIKNSQFLEEKKQTNENLIPN